MCPLSQLSPELSLSPSPGTHHRITTPEIGSGTARSAAQTRVREVTRDIPRCVGQTTPNRKAQPNRRSTDVCAGRCRDTPMDPNAVRVRLIGMTRPSHSPPALRLAAVMVVALICGAWSTFAVSAATARPHYDWPLQPRPPVTRGFDPPAQRWQAGHRGVDLGTTSDSAVLAARAGTVTFAGPVAGRPTISVLHADGITTTYEPVQPTVRRGDHVQTGQVLGYLQSGHAGCRAATCLHWGARRGTGRQATYVNPLGLLGLLRVRLKPVVSLANVH